MQKYVLPLTSHRYCGSEHRDNNQIKEKEHTDPRRTNSESQEIVDLNVGNFLAVVMSYRDLRTLRVLLKLPDTSYPVL